MLLQYYVLYTCCSSWNKIYSSEINCSKPKDMYKGSSGTSRYIHYMSHVCNVDFEDFSNTFHANSHAKLKMWMQILKYVDANLCHDA